MDPGDRIGLGELGDVRRQCSQQTQFADIEDGVQDRRNQVRGIQGIRRRFAAVASRLKSVQLQRA